jgi:hypothetical protein
MGISKLCNGEIESRRNRSHCATRPYVAGSIPDGAIDIYHYLKPSGSTMIVGSTQLIKK